MKWCCSALMSWHRAIDSAGFGIVIAPNQSGQPTFVLQHRSVDKYASPPNPPGVQMTLVSRVAIGYCPSCGRNLKRWYRSHGTELYNAESVEQLLFESV